MQHATVALQQFREKRSSIDIVVGEYGQISGLVTVANILAEIVGEMGVVGLLAVSDL